MGFYNRFDCFSGCDCRNTCGRDYGEQNMNYDYYNNWSEGQFHCGHKRERRECGCYPALPRCRENVCGENRCSPCLQHRHRRCCCPICSLINFICK